MTRLSSRYTFFYKRVFPVIWFGLLALFACAVVAAAIEGQQLGALIPPILILLFLAVVGFVVMKKLFFDLVDVVWDWGDSLIVKYKGIEHQIELSEFMRLSHTGFMNSQRITLSLRNPSADLGTEVTFIPPTRMFPFSMSPVAIDLMSRIDAAQRKEQKVRNARRAGRRQ